VGPAVVSAKYKYDATNWDMSLGNSGSTSVASTFLQYNVGNAGTLSGKAFSFFFTNVPGSGILFELRDSTTRWIEAWGSGFGAALPSAGPGVNVQLVPTLPNAPGGFLPDRAFNTIQIAARANTAARTATITEMTFSSPTLSIGPGSSLVSPTVTSATVDPVRVGYPAPGAPGTGQYTQWIVAPNAINLADFAWTLSGTVTLSRSDGTNPNEGLKLVLTGAPADVQTVPEPSTLAMAAIGGGLLLLAYRRNG
jgi:hypothetical protein